MKSLSELAKVVAPDRVAAFGAVRRMAITLTTKALWQLAGFVIDGVTEVMKAEPFTGIGIAARPPTTGKPEAIVINVGDAKNPMIIAVRDEKTRAAIAGAIKAGETMLFTPLSVVYMKDDGTIEARSAGGAAQALATKADVQAIRNELHLHTHPAGTMAAPSGGGPVTGITGAGPAVTAPSGTTKLKGE